MRAIDDLDDTQASENREFEDASRRLCVQTPAAFGRPARSKTAGSRRLSAPLSPNGDRYDPGVGLGRVMRVYQR